MPGPRRGKEQARLRPSAPGRGWAGPCLLVLPFMGLNYSFFAVVNPGRHRKIPQRALYIRKAQSGAEHAANKEGRVLSELRHRRGEQTPKIRHHSDSDGAQCKP
ncbi:hypothetical protein NDU88_001172 [Pleurodeles waltl]|uniref:Uncharacterized protein n=1 Tax=Pleurodeles waltl TaxID=8319 RepID=A0AAV7TH40_PLEWA|nr:hypothetical protein NDU88_001172 [Pleurodeles waltl]